MTAPLAIALLLALAAPPEAREGAEAPASTGVLLDRIAAVVGDDIILESEVEKLTALRYLPPRAGESDRAYRDRILDELVIDALRERELRKTGGLAPDPAEVETRLKALAARVESERGVPFDEVLKRAGMTRGDAAGIVRRGLMLETFTRERLSATVRVTEAEIKSYYDGPFREEAREKKVETLPPLSEVTDEVRELLRERKLNEAVSRWTDELRQSTRVLVYRR
jgi:hypothetical protein